MADNHDDLRISDVYLSPGQVSKDKTFSIIALIAYCVPYIFQTV